MTAPRPEQRVTLRAAPPVRALAIGSAGALVGAVLIVVTGSLDLPVVVTVLGVVIGLLALALVVAALVLSARLTTHLVLGPETLTIRRGRTTRTLPWSQIDRVSLQDRRLVVRGKGDEPGAAVLNPRTADDPVFTGLVTALQERLDADRGYQQLS